MKAKSGAGKSSLRGSETKMGIHVIICSEERETQMVWEKWFWKITTHLQLLNFRIHGYFKPDISLYVTL